MINNLGKIHGSLVNGRSSIKIDSSNVDITGNLLTKGIINFSLTNEELASADPSGILSRFDSLDNRLNTLLTSNNDACFNNVDVSGTLNVQGEKVMTVPALDICGNDLSANTTYEITTGPVGNINNISFVKKNSRVYFSVQMGTNNTHTSRPVTHTTLNWNTASIITSDVTASNNFTANGYVIPRNGIYKIDCNQMIRCRTRNSAAGSIFVYRHRSGVATLIAQGTMAITNRINTTQTDEHGIRNVGVVILASLETGDRITFDLDCDGGIEFSNSTFGCYTIISVD
jgi:hypothetical protein